MKYAPVLIPTINRFQHFKECLESLSNCTWADKTDVFVAVDYPAKEEHWEGYNKIKEYLDHCGDLGFRSLNVIYREKNYFFTEKGNLGALVEEIEKKYDRFILTEDDNVFSPNFIEFIDKGLEMYEDDKSVIAINGYRHFYPIRFSDNTFYRQNVDFSGWGYGIWRDRNNALIEFQNMGFYKTFNIKKAIKMIKNGRNRFCWYLNLAARRRKIVMSDNPLSVYMAIHDMDVIMPAISTVRNQGWDDSGIHCPTSDKSLAEKHMKQDISSDEEFEYIGTGFEYYDYNRKVHADNNQFVKTSCLTVYLTIFKFIIKRIISVFCKYE